MPRQIKLKDTMRKSAKVEPTAAEVTSPSSDSVSTNPWADAQSELNGDTLSRHTSKTSQSPGPSVNHKTSSSPGPARSIQESISDGTKDIETNSTLHVPDTVDEDSQVTTKKVTRRKKTVTKTTPHTFEVADLTPPPKESKPTTEEQKPDALNPPKSSLKRQSRSDPHVNISFSRIKTTANLEPIAPRPKPAAKNPFKTSNKARQSSSNSLPTFIPSSNPTRFTPASLDTSDYAGLFYGKVLVITHGATPIGASIVKFFHSSGARVIFGDTNGEAAKKLLISLGPPHVVHYNKCDDRKYDDLLDLFKLAVTMYGRVDHAIYGVGEDGGHTGGIGQGETGWFEHVSNPGIEGVQKEPPGLFDTIASATRFAHIALAYLKYSSKGRKNVREVNSKTQEVDRSLTFLTSVASFKETPGLPIYQIAQHGLMGLVRSLRLGVDPDRDHVRVNTVLTGMMVPRAVSGSGGRMSVKLPSDMPEDVGRTIVGVVAAGSLGEGNGTGIWYERGSERGPSERKLHGRAIYVVGGECWDVEEGLRRSEAVWLGGTPTESLTRAMEGLGRDSQWILDLQ